MQKLPRTVFFTFTVFKVSHTKTFKYQQDDIIYSRSIETNVKLKQFCGKSDKLIAFSKPKMGVK